jgi:hypothetical protein
METEKVMARLLDEMKAETKINQEKTDANVKKIRVEQEHIKEEMRAGQKLLKEEMLAKMVTNQEGMDAKIDAGQEMVEARIDANDGKLEVVRSHVAGRGTGKEG